MKKYSRVGIFVCMAASLLMLSGCGKKEENVFQPGLDTEKDVTLSVAGFFGNFEALDQVTADFNAYYPNVEFSYEQISMEGYDEYLQANPDVSILMTSEQVFHEFGDQLTDVYADLSKADIDLSDIDEKMLKQAYHDGKLTSIPIGQNIYGIVVNESLLEKEGLQVPDTYDEFLNALSVLKEKGYTPIQGPDSKVYAELTQSMLFDLLLSDEALYEDLMAGRDSAIEKLAPVMDKLKTIIDNGYTDLALNQTYPSDNYDEAILKFFEGDVPFWVCNTEKVSGMKKRESKSEAFTASPFTYTFIYAPLGEKGVYAYREPWYGMAVNQNSTEYDYAVEFIRFLTTKDEINEMADIKGVPSVAASENDVEIYRNVMNPEKVEKECVNEGKITADLVTNWYACVNGYATGKYEDTDTALQDFVKSCGGQKAE